MHSAIQNLQKAIQTGSQSVTELLKQARVIAIKLDLQDMKRWIDLELFGYSKYDKLPNYRLFVSIRIRLDTPQSTWSYKEEFPLPPGARQSIEEIEALSKGSGTYLGNDTYLDALQYKQVVEDVKNELLGWTIDLERRGIRGKNSDFDQKEKESAQKMIFNIGSVQGNVGNVSNSQAVFNNYHSLHQTLLDSNVPTRERHELEGLMEALKTAPPEKRPSLVQKGKVWIVKNQKLLGATAEVVAKAIGATLDKNKP